MIRNLWPIWIILFCFFLYNIIKVNHFLYCFIIFLHIISSFSLTRTLFVPYTYVSLKSIDHILLPLFELKEILLISSVKTLCLSNLNLCFVFNINLWFFMNSFYEIFFSIIYVNLIIFLNFLFYYQVKLLLNCFYNFQIYVFYLWYNFLCLLFFHLRCCHLLSSYNFLLLIEQFIIFLPNSSFINPITFLSFRQWSSWFEVSNLVSTSSAISL